MGLLSIKEIPEKECYNGSSIEEQFSQINQQRGISRKWGHFGDKMQDVRYHTVAKMIVDFSNYVRKLAKNLELLHTESTSKQSRQKDLAMFPGWVLDICLSLSEKGREMHTRHFGRSMIRPNYSVSCNFSVSEGIKWNLGKLKSVSNSSRKSDVA